MGGSSTKQSSSTAVSELQKALRVGANKRCRGEGSPFVREASQADPFRMQQCHPGSLHHHYSTACSREESIDAFHRSEDEDLDLDALFKRAKEFAKPRLAETSRRPLKGDKRAAAQANIVALVGKPGIGKTAIANLIARRMIDQRFLNVQWIFYLDLDKIVWSRKCNLLEFLVKNSAFEWKCDQNKKAVLTLLNKSDQVFIILDGLDKVAMSLKSEGKHVKLYGDARPIDFLKGLLSGTILSKSKKLMTSWSSCLKWLHASLQPHFVVKVMGLTADSQEQLCRDICEEHYNEAQSYLFDNAYLSSYCYFPAVCSVVMQTLHREMQSKTKTGECDVRTVTRAFVGSLPLFIQEKCTKESGLNVEHLARFSWLVGCQSYRYFDECPLRLTDVAFDNAEEGLRQGITNGEGISMLGENSASPDCFSFIQTCFLASLYIMFYMPLEMFEKNISDPSSLADVIIAFLFGLCDPSNLYALSFHVPTEQTSTTTNSKVDLLKKYAAKSMEEFRGSKIFTDMSSSRVYDSHIFHRVCSWVYESQRADFAEEASGVLKESVSLCGEFIPRDVQGLHFLLQERRKPLLLAIGDGEVPSSCLFYGDSLQRFFGALNVALKSNEHLQLSAVDCSLSDIGDGGVTSVASCVHGMRALRLDDCAITSLGVGVLTEAIGKRRQQMDELTLSRNNVGDADAISIATCMNNLKSLKLQNCGISATGVAAMSGSLQQLCEPLQELDLDQNSIGDEGAIALAPCCEKVKYLKLGGCGITGLGIKAISDSIKRLKLPMELVSFSYNDISDEEVGFISSCLPNIKRLELLGCHVTSAGLKSFCQALKDLPEPMKCLRLALHSDLREEAEREFTVCEDKVLDLQLTFE